MAAFGDSVAHECAVYGLGTPARLPSHSPTHGVCAQVASKVTRILEMDPQRRGLKYRSNARKLKQTTAHHWQVLQTDLLTD